MFVCAMISSYEIFIYDPLLIYIPYQSLAHCTQISVLSNQGRLKRKHLKILNEDSQMEDYQIQWTAKHGAETASCAGHQHGPENIRVALFVNNELVPLRGFVRA